MHSNAPIGTVSPPTAPTAGQSRGTIPGTASPGTSKGRIVPRLRLRTNHPWVHQLVVWGVVTAILARCLFSAPGEFRWIFPVGFAAIAYYATATWPWIFAILGTSYMAMQSILRPGISASSTISLLTVCLLSAGWGQHLRRQLIDEQVRSRRDPVTGLLNARGFEEQLQAEIARSTRHFREFALVYLDCDRFKEVNDVQGHQVGDALLKVVGNVLETNIRSFDAAARVGGDEFAVLISEVDEATALSVVERLLANLRATVLGMNSPTTFSVGVVTFPKSPPDAATCLAMADQAMYHVKRHGRDGIHLVRYSDGAIMTNEGVASGDIAL